MKAYRFLPLLALLLLCPGSEALSRSNFPRPAQLSNHSFCGAYPGRIKDEIHKARALRQLIEPNLSRMALRSRVAAARDVGNVSIIEDDGTIVSQANPFDLASTNLRMVPSGATTFSLSVQPGSLNQDLGTKLSLSDDDYSQITFPTGFHFPFLGGSYGSVFINSDGNVTFTQGDDAHTDRDLGRFNGGPPRIATLFDDLDPTLGDGGVYYNALADRFLITWNRVREYGGTQPNTVQLALYSDGSFELTYGSITASSLIVGWSAGQGLQTVNLIDLSKSSGTLPSGPVAEHFSTTTEIDFTSLAKAFYLTHPDNFEQLAIYTNFPYAIGQDTFAFEAGVKNDIQGINLETFDYSQEFGSAGRLQSFLAMNQLAAFPADPDTIAVRTYSTVAVMAHETAHRWLAYPLFRQAGADNGDLLGYQQAHWSFFFNADASLMEGHSIDDNGNGSFTITGATTGFGKLDQYLMGLRNAAEVGPLFYVKPAAGSHHVPTDVTEPSDIGLTFSGTRADLSAYDIIAALGPRIPDAVSAPKVIHQATILLVLPGTSPTADELAKLTRMQQRFQSYFAQATEGLGTVDIQLSGAQPVISSVSPSSGSTLGNTQVYISGNDFQAGATVSFGGVSATNVQFVSSTLLIATTGPSPAGPVAITLTNPGAQAIALPNAYTYQVYAPVTVPATALRIPYAVDTVYFRSNLGINNPNPTEATVQLLELDNNGLQVSSPASVKIPGNGYLQINSVLAYLEGAASSTGREGSLVLKSDLPIQGFVSQIENETGDPSILDGIQTGATRLILQSSANTGPFRSNLVVLNLSQNPAVVTLTALSRDTGQPIGTPLANLSIAGNGFITYANVLEALSVADSYGPVEIRSLNGAQLVAVSRVSGLNAGTSGFFAAQSEDSGSHSEIIPFVIDTDTFRTNLGINNLGSDVANFQITWFDKQGNGITLASARRSVQVAPLGMLQINNILRFLINGSSNSNITNQEGYLQITADQPIRAFATQIHNLTQDPSIEESVSSGSSHLLLKSSANLEFKSTVVIVNPNDVPVSATILARQGEPSGNGNVTATQTITIPAKGYFSSDNVLQDLGATSTFGPIEIISAANLPLIAVSRVYDSTANTSGFFSAEPLP